jgi:hypothetical protein
MARERGVGWLWLVALVLLLFDAIVVLALVFYDVL